jgi:glycosyltransferase involved in cell wall biosynthesis
MRVLHTVASRDWGGVAHRTTEQVNWLNARSHQSWLACPPDSEIAERAAQFGAPVIPFDFDRPFSLITAWRLRSLVKRLQCDVVDSHTGRCSNAAIAAASLAAIVRSRHTIQPLRSTFWRRWRGRNAWDWTIATAQITADRLNQAGLTPSGRLSVIGEWAEDRYFAVCDRAEYRTRWRAAVGVPQDSFVIGAIGMLRPEKGFDTIIRAMRPLLAQGADIHLVIVGEAPASRDIYKQELLALRKELSLGGRVHFIGFVEDIHEILHSFDVLCAPSSFDAQTRVIPEAMASGIPVVASRIGGIPEIIEDGKTGFLIEPADHDALYRVIEELSRTPEERSRVSQAAADFARRFLTIDAKMGETLDAYQSALDRRRSARRS